jgi:3-methyladenine DNA glycosylase AlkD
MAKSKTAKKTTAAQKQHVVITDKNKSSIKNTINAKQFVARLKTLQSPEELKKIVQYFKLGQGEYSEGDKFIGVQMGKIFALAKEFIDMPLDEITELLKNPIHEVRVGGVSIMDFQARSKKTTENRKKELFDLYINYHHCINNWDLVDRAAPYVIGSYLINKSRKILYTLAKSKIIWERRTAIVSTAYFIKQGDVTDTFKIAALLLNDKHDLIHKAAGGWLREAGKGKHREQLLQFLDTHAAIMPRVFLRNAIEHLDKKQRDHYLNMKKVITAK